MVTYKDKLVCTLNIISSLSLCLTMVNFMVLGLDTLTVLTMLHTRLDSDKFVSFPK